MTAPLLAFGGNAMKPLNLHEIYIFGKQLRPLADIEPDTRLASKFFDLWSARARLQETLKEEAAMLPPTRRAVQKLIDAVTSIVPEDWEKASESMGNKDKTIGYYAYDVVSALTELDAVLANDMPGIASYIVSQKGIYRTEDLIQHPERQLDKAICSELPEQALLDIQQAGRCLAFELPIACAFHLWRALESVMGAYYEKLTGNSFSDGGIQSNWGAYIKGLQAAKAETKITAFLDHIREEYRNPHTHPEEIISVEESLRLFPVALSSIDQIMRTTKSLPVPAKAKAQVELVKAMASMPS